MAEAAAELTSGIKLISHDCVRILTAQGAAIYIDPFEMPDSPHDGTLILVTHDHFDHFSPEDIERAAAPGATMVVPNSLEDQARELSGKLGLGPVLTVEAGQTLPRSETMPATVHAVPAYNIGKPFHPAENGWLGYVVETDGIRIFHTGDADRTPDNEHVACDVLLVPVGGTYTMDAEEAVGFTLSVRPRVAVPMHYGTAVGEPGDGAHYAELLAAAQDDIADDEKIPAAVLMGL